MEHEGKLRMRRSIQYVEEEGYLGSCKGESTSSRKSFWKEVRVYQKVRVVRVREEKWEVGGRVSSGKLRHQRILYRITPKNETSLPSPVPPFPSVAVRIAVYRSGCSYEIFFFAKKKLEKYRPSTSSSSTAINLAQTVLHSQSVNLRRGTPAAGSP